MKKKIKIYVNNDEMMKFISNFDSYFTTNKKLLFECKEGRIYEHNGDKANIFRKGIRCYDFHSNSIYDYDFNEIEINESRVITSAWDAYAKMWRIIFQCTNKEVIKKILMNLNNDDNCFELNLYDISGAARNISSEFKEVLSELKLVPSGYAGMLDSRELLGCTIVPTKFYRGIEDIIEDVNKASVFQSTAHGHFFKEFEPDPLQEATLKKVTDFLEEAGFNVPYDIIIARFANKDILGAANIEKSLIYVSDVCLTRGVNEVVNTIIEEFIHIKYQASDETRKFQDAIIAEFIDYMKMKNAYVL